MNKLTRWLSENAGPVLALVVVGSLFTVLFGLKVILDLNQNAIVDRKRAHECQSPAIPDHKPGDPWHERIHVHECWDKGLGGLIHLVISQGNLVADCVGQKEGGECQKRLMTGQVNAFNTLNANLTKSVADELARRFGILQGQLKITVVQEPGKPTEILVGGAQPGKDPPDQVKLPPGTIVQECVVEIHAEPLLGACAVPRP
jgi:hypothetical protein